MDYPQLAAIGAGLLIVGVAAFQLALAFGLPLGEATFGGRAPTQNGVLLPAFRFVAAISSLALVLVALIVAARADLLDIGFFSDRIVYWTMWVIVGFLAQNTSEISRPVIQSSVG